MDLSNLKITAADYDGKDIESLPDTIAGDADNVKKRFDAMSKELIVPRFNALVDNVEDLYSALMLAMNPVGTIIMNITGQNPSEYIGGTWVAWCKGRTPVGLGSVEANTTTSFGNVTAGELDWWTVEAKGGEYSHTLVTSEIPNHSHAHTTLASNTSGSDWVGASGTAKASSRNTSGTGGGGGHNNVMPYQTCYFWKRTA